MRANGRRQLSRETHGAGERFVERAHFREHGLLDSNVLTHARGSRRNDEQRCRELVHEHGSVTD
jgi:hypothetical protein